MKSTEMGSKGFVVAITCHDAGSSELISRCFSKSNFTLLTDVRGPAKEIFRRNGISSSMDFVEITQEIDLLVTGISWMDRSYVSLIHQARLREIKVVTFLDHWTFDFKDFTFGDLVCLPDAFVVFDQFAYLRAKELFPETALLMLPNHYIASLRNDYLQNSSPDGNSNRRLLYVSEPISKSENILDVQGNPIDKGNFFSELDAYKFLISNIKYINPDIDHIIIRPHPSENSDKFGSEYLDENIMVSVSANSNLVSDLARVQTVAGSHTMALAISVKLGIRSISLVPEGSGDCVIPYPQIEMLRDLIPTSN